MKGTKLFKNARLKGQKELVSILVEDGIINYDRYKSYTDIFEEIKNKKKY